MNRAEERQAMLDEIEALKLSKESIRLDLNLARAYLSCAVNSLDWDGWERNKGKVSLFLATLKEVYDD